MSLVPRRSEAAMNPESNRARVRAGRWAGVWLTALTVTFSASTWAVHPLTIVEDSLEMRAATVQLPDSSTGVVVLAECPGCRLDRYRIAVDAEFTLAGQPVSYAEMRNAARSGRYRKLFMGVLRSSGEISTMRVLP